MKNNKILLTSTNNLLSYNFNTGETTKLCTIPGSRLMGIASDNNNLYVANHGQIYRIKNTIEKVFDFGNLKFHHMKVRNNVILIMGTKTNSIYLCILKSGRYKKVKVGNGNNHINCIFINNNHIYLTLNKSDEDSAYSSVVVYDGGFEEVDRFMYGWQSHGFCIIDNKKYTTCNYWSGQGRVKHPAHNGLMIDGEIKIKFREDEFFKDISVDNNYIYIVGSICKPRKERNKTDGIIYRIDRRDKNYNKERIVIKDSGDLSGCLLLNYDLTN